MASPNMTSQSLYIFEIPGVLRSTGDHGPKHIILSIEAEDREDARWQVHHGVIEMNVAKKFPGETVQYDLRRMRQSRR